MGTATTTSERGAATLTAALMTGKRASEGNADRAVALYRHILAALDTAARTLPAQSPLDVGNLSDA
jgi:hypothetical protein